MSKNVVIFGVGGHARVITDIVKANGDVVIGYLDDKDASMLPGVRILGKTYEALKLPKDYWFVLGIGSNAIRDRIASEYKLKWYTAIHPSAVISPTAVIDEGTVVMACAVINASAHIGKHVIINTGVIIEHDCIIGDFCHMSPRSALGGTVTIGNRSHIGIGAVISNNLTICNDCIIGAGAAVIRNITEPGTYIGVPVRKVH